MKFLSLVALCGLLSVTACSHKHKRDCCKDKESCSKEQKKDCCKDKKEKADCKDGSCEKKK